MVREGEIAGAGFFCYFCAMAQFSSHSEAVVTVVVPAYNAARWLDQALGSVAAQSVACWRVVVADDGSSDETAAIARRFAEADGRFTLLELPHGGVSAARNAALELASTEWVMLLDADDLLHPQMLELSLAAAAEAVDIVVPLQRYGDVPESFAAITDLRGETLGSGEALRRLLLRRGIEASMSGRLYRRRLFESPEPLRFRNCRYEDLDLGYRVMERARRVALLPEELYFYRRHDGSFMRSLTPERFDVLDVTDRMYEHFRGTALEDAAADRRFGAHCNILLVMYSYGEVSPAVERRCLSVIRTHRRGSLFGRGVRLKNRLGALASYGGGAAMRLLATLIPQR